MNMKLTPPYKIESALGNTQHNQRVRLVLEVDANGRHSVSIHRDAGDQRDDSVTIACLPPELVIAMGEVIKGLTS